MSEASAGTLERSLGWRGVVSLGALPLAILAVALLTAYIGAQLTNGPIGSVNTEVEGLSSSSTGFLKSVSTYLPFGFAFGAGMVSAVNPCGFSLLPAYLGLFLADDKDAEAPQSRLRHALVVSGTMTAGFVLLFAVVGVVIGSGAQFLVDSFPWIGLGIGIALVAGASVLITGKKGYSTLAQQFASKIGGGSTNSSNRGIFLFGLSYGTASLSCTLPVFLLVIGGSITASSILPSLGQFLLYGLGMASVITALTISIALFESALVGPLRKVMEYVEPISAVMLLIAGTYIVYYWLTLGGLLDRLS